MMKELKFSLADKKGTDTIVAAILGGRLFLVLMADVVQRTGHNVNHAFGIRLPKDRQILELLKWMMKELKFSLADKKGTDTIVAAILGGRLFLVLMADVVQRTGHNVNHAFGIRLPKDRQILELLKWMMKEPKFSLADKKGTDTIVAAILGGRLFLVLMADVVQRTGHNVNHAFGIRLPKDRQILELLKWMMKEPKFSLADKKGTDTIVAAILGGRLFLVLMADVVQRTGHNVNHAFGFSSRNNFSHRRIGSSEVFFSWSFTVKKQCVVPGLRAVSVGPWRRWSALGLCKHQFFAIHCLCFLFMMPEFSFGVVSRNAFEFAACYSKVVQNISFWKATCALRWCRVVAWHQVKHIRSRAPEKLFCVFVKPQLFMQVWA